MGTWTLWIAFNAGVAVLLVLDVGLFHRRAHAVPVREAAVESGFWIALSLAFGAWIFASHGHNPALEFFTGYVIEKSLSIDNIFVFLLVFQYFRVDPRYQHRLLFWGVLGALVLRGGMIAAGAALIHRFGWVLYLFGAFLIYAGLKMFRADHAVHPEKNPVVRWAKRILPVARGDGSGGNLLVRENGKWMLTPLVVVILVLETTDLVFAVDSIPAVFGVTRDPFIVYTSNVCAILGLRALYFLLVGVLPYFRYLDEGLAIVLMFVGAKMLAEPWLHVSTGASLILIGAVLALAVLISLLAASRESKKQPGANEELKPRPAAPNPSSGADAMLIDQLGGSDAELRESAARLFWKRAGQMVVPSLRRWEADGELAGLFRRHAPSDSQGQREDPALCLTAGIAIQPASFERIRAANGSPPLADVPPDQDALEFELHFPEHVQLDILTTKAPDAGGAIARFLEKFGEGIQQIELDVTDVDRAAEILRTRFEVQPIYPAARPGANGTRVNFFLVPADGGKKILVELVQQRKV